MLDQPPVIPIALHEGVIEKRFFRRKPDQALIEDVALRTAHRGMHEARNYAEQARSAFVSIMADNSMTTEARLVRARTAVSKLADVIARKLDGAAEKLRSELHSSQRSTWRPHGQPSPLDAEIRGALRSMSVQDRSLALARALDSGDDEIFRAVLAAPALLVGMMDEEHAARRGMWRKARHPANVERESRLQLALDDIERAGEATIGWVAKMFETSQAEQAMKAASDATAAAIAAAKASEAA